MKTRLLDQERRKAGECLSIEVVLLYSFVCTRSFLVVSEKQKCFPRISMFHLLDGPSNICKSWVVVISCQCREEEEICVSSWQLAVASTKFLVIFRELDLPLEVLGMCHFLLSGIFQLFSSASCWYRMEGEDGEKSG